MTKTRSNHAAYIAGANGYSRKVNLREAAMAKNLREAAMALFSTCLLLLCFKFSGKQPIVGDKEREEEDANQQALVLQLQRKE
ncbi:hypothetical protein Bca4012_068401 [Brassica carinata]